MSEIRWPRVAVGVGFIYVSQLLLAGVDRAFGEGVEPLVFHQALFLGFTLFSFFLGGFVAGLLSSRRAILEPLLAALGAALLDAALPPLSAAQTTAGSWAFVVTTGFLLALIGGWMGLHVPTPTNRRAPQVMFWFALLVIVFGLPATLLAMGLPAWAVAVLVAIVGGVVYLRLMQAKAATSVSVRPGAAAVVD